MGDVWYWYRYGMVWYGNGVCYGFVLVLYCMYFIGLVMVRYDMVGLCYVVGMIRYDMVWGGSTLTNQGTFYDIFDFLDR